MQFYHGMSSRSEFQVNGTGEKREGDEEDPFCVLPTPHKHQKHMTAQGGGGWFRKGQIACSGTSFSRLPRELLRHFSADVQGSTL